MEAKLSKSEKKKAKESIRKSGKKVEELLSSSSDFVSAVVDKDGVLSLLVKDKWRPFYFALCGGMLFWKKRESSTSIVGEISLKGGEIEKSEANSSKTNFAISIKSGDKKIVISTEKEDGQTEWIKALQENIDKGPSAAPTGAPGRRDSRIMRAQKKVGGSVATSAAGKKIIKEALGNGGYKGMMIIKKVVASVDGKKKATEVEDALIKLSVKVILLSKNKDLRMDDLRRHYPAIKALCESMAHHITFSFEYTEGPNGNIHQLVNQLAKEVSETLSKHFSAKNLSRFNELHAYLTSGPIIDALYMDPNLKNFRSDWHYLMKNIIFHLDPLVAKKKK